VTRRSHPRPWHRGSLFGDGPRVPLDRERRARFRFLLNAHIRAGRLPDKQGRVGEALLKRLSEDGRCDPSQATLAADANVSESTVGNATKTMRGLGLLRWQRRLVRVGARVQQTSNAYELVPSASLPPILPRFSSDRKTSGETLKVDSFFCSDVSPAAFSEAQQALVQRRAVAEARLLNNKRPI
jgi:hypothetical protein